MLKRVITFPRLGEEYTKQIVKSFEILDLNIVLPPKITDKTIKLGVKYSPDMMCFPYKVTLGNFIEALDKGANTLLMYDTCGQCRFRHYFKLQDFVLKDLGYNFDMLAFNKRNFIPVFKKLSGKSSFAVVRCFRDMIKGIKEITKIIYNKSK